MIKLPYLFDINNTCINLPKTELPIAKIYEVKLSGWSCDPNGKVTVFPECNFDNSKMIKCTIIQKKK